MANGIVLVAALGVLIAALWRTFGWEVGGGVLLMAVAAALADFLWARLTGRTVSEWIRMRYKRYLAVLVAVFLLAAVFLLWHFIDTP